MEQEISAILLHYPIHPEQIMTLKNNRIWKVIGKDKNYILKALSFPKRESDFILGAMSHLEEKGFGNFNQLVKTVEGENHIFFRERTYFLSTEIEGREADFQSDKDLKELGHFLGGFHNHSKGYFPPNPYEGRVKWDAWDPMVKEKKENLLSFCRENKRESYFDIAFCRYLDYFLEDLEKAVPFFSSESFLALCQGEKKAGAFCHHDLAHHNFLMGESAAIIDFDYALYDVRCHDIVNFLGKVLKANHWEEEKAMTALTAYNQVRPLEDAECEAIKSMLRFPQDYWQCAFARYVEGDLSHRTEKKLKHWLKERTLRRNALQNLETLF